MDATMEITMDATVEATMDSTNVKLMNLLQKGLPLEKNPYGILSDQLGITRSEVLARIKDLVQEGYIRRLGGTFNNAGMGYTSLLFGVQVPEDNFEEVADFVNSFTGVTHNYQRSGRLNMWFTFSFSDYNEKESLVQSLRKHFDGLEIHEFSNLQNFKLNVYFDLEGR